MIRCFADFARNLCSGVGICLTMQKFFRQSNVWVKPQSLAVVGLLSRFPSGSHSCLAPTARTAHRDNRCQPTSTAKEPELEPPTAKAAWPHHALGCWPDEHKRASTSPWYPPGCAVCGLSRFWLCRSLSAPFFGGLDALAVQDNGAGLCHTSGFQAHFLAQGIVQPFQRAVTPPTPVTRMNRAPMGKLTGQHSPLTAGAQNVKNRIHDAATFDLRGTTKALFDKRANMLPLRITQIR